MDTNDNLANLLSEKKALEQKIADLKKEVKILVEAQRIISVALLHEETDENANFTVFHFKPGFLSAKLIVKDDEFILLKGSEIDSTRFPNSTRPVIKTKRNQAINKHMLTPLSESPGIYKLEEDMSFSDPSMAVCFVGGGSRNGWIEWVDDNDRTLFFYKNQIKKNKKEAVKKKAEHLVTVSESSKKQLTEKPKISIKQEEKLEHVDIIDSYRNSGGPVFNLSSKGVKAYLEKRETGFVICKGSEINNPSPVNPQYKDMRTFLDAEMRKRTLSLISGNRYRVEDEFVFSSSTDAMKFVLGGRFDSSTDWMTDDGISLSEYLQYTSKADKTENDEGSQELSTSENNTKYYGAVSILATENNDSLPKYQIRGQETIKVPLVEPTAFAQGCSRNGDEWGILNDTKQLAKSDKKVTSLDTNTINDMTDSRTDKILSKRDSSLLEIIIPVTDFNNPAHYNLKGFVFDGVRYNCQGFRELPYQLLSILNKQEPTILDRIRYSIKRESYKKAFISKYTYLLDSPREVSDGIFIEMEGADSTMIIRAKKLLKKYQKQECSLLLIASKKHI